MNGPEKYILTDKGDIYKYIGVNIDRFKKGSIELRYPYLIQRYLEAMEVNDKMNIKCTPAKKTPTQRQGWQSKEELCEDPMTLHEVGVIHIEKYILGKKYRGMVFTPNKNKGLEYFLDAEFTGGWQQADADNP